MRKLTRLWQTLEKIPGLLAVPALWKAECGDEFKFIEPFLRPTDTLGALYPCPLPMGGDCPRKIVEHGPDDLVAICRDPHQRCENVALAPKEGLLHKIELATLLYSISAALGVAPQSLTPRRPGTWVVGLSRQRRTREQPVFLLIYNRQQAFLDALRQLALETTGSFIIVAPTEKFWDVTTHELLASRHAHFISFAETIFADETGSLIVRQTNTADRDRPRAAPGPYPRRAAWLEAELGLRQWSVHDLQSQGGPDWKTSRKILDGLPVSRAVLEKSVAALSQKKQRVRFKDVPED